MDILVLLKETNVQIGWQVINGTIATLNMTPTLTINYSGPLALFSSLIVS